MLDGGVTECEKTIQCFMKALDKQLLNYGPRMQHNVPKEH